jgi:hypothetical protein
MKIHQIRNKRPTKWRITWWVLKCILLTAIITRETTQSRMTGGEENMQTRQYNLTHDRKIINLPGSACPIKTATMTMNRKRIRDSKRSRKILCEKMRLLEMQTKDALLGIIGAILNGIANIGGAIHGTTKALTTGWRSVLGIAMIEFYETMTSFLNEENTGSTCFIFRLLIRAYRIANINGAINETTKALIICWWYVIRVIINEVYETLISLLNDESTESTCFIFRLLIKMTIHISARRYVVGDSNSGEYQSNHRAEKEPSEKHRNEDKNGNENENGAAETGGGKKETERTPDGGMAYWYDFNNPPKEEEGLPETEEVVGAQKTWVPNLNANEFIPENQQEMIPNDKEELDEDGAALKRFVFVLILILFPP